MPTGMRDGAMALPAELREVSGVVALDDHRVACVQDERGVVYELDLATGAFVARRFGKRGDYEGLTRLGADYWALRSDGVLLRVVDADGDLRVAAEHRLGLPFRDWEGLCAASPDRLLVAPKIRTGDDETRPVFAFDVAATRLIAEPFAVIRRDVVATAVGPRPDGSGAIELACSDLVVVPGRSELLLLSAVDRLLVRVTLDGRVLAWRWLEVDGLTKPEGLAWLADGRLLIASEGRGGAGRLQIVPVP
jgi:hypothetical protein